MPNHSDPHNRLYDIQTERGRSERRRRNKPKRSASQRDADLTAGCIVILVCYFLYSAVAGHIAVHNIANMIDQWGGIGP